MHWFYFKVLNWWPNQQITFNIVNLCRDLTKFYQRGMSILTRVESVNGAFKSDWQIDKNIIQVLEGQASNDIVRSYRKDDPSVANSYYSSMKFKCTFPPIQNLNPNATDQTKQAFGTVFCFAYALPYVYSELLTDLKIA